MCEHFGNIGEMSEKIVQNESPIPSFDLYDWCFVTVFGDHSTTDFSEGIPTNVVLTSIAACLGSGIELEMEARGR